MQWDCLCRGSGEVTKMGDGQQRQIRWFSGKTVLTGWWGFENLNLLSPKGV